MALGISRRAYAKLRGVSHRAINYAVSTGLIPTLRDGSIDVEAADRTWGAARAERQADETPLDPAAWEARIDELAAEFDRRMEDEL